MALFLFAISFVHFGSVHPRQMWEGEIALHHAGLPLALLVILQDYRFLFSIRFSGLFLTPRWGLGPCCCAFGYSSLKTSSGISHIRLMPGCCL